MITLQGESPILFLYNKEFVIGNYPKKLSDRKNSQKHQFNYTIKENEEDWSFNLSIKFHDFSAISFRNHFKSLEKNLQKEKNQAILSKRYKRNRLMSYKVEGLESNKDIMMINIQFAND